MQSSLYLFVEFDWPNELTKETAGLAKQLHTQVTEVDWIEEVIAASGGLGGELGSVWVFKVENYAALDRLLRDREDEIAQTYMQFFSRMAKVRDRVREEVIFR